LYGVDVRTGELLFRKTLPDVVPFKWMLGTAQWDYVKGPHGSVWTTLGNVLVRIDPLDAHVEVIGRLPATGRMTFVGDDLYLSGTTSIRRLADIAAVPEAAETTQLVPIVSVAFASFALLGLLLLLGSKNQRDPASGIAPS
jgi:hypothetical protein